MCVEHLFLPHFARGLSTRKVYAVTVSVVFAWAMKMPTAFETIG